MIYQEEFKVANSSNTQDLKRIFNKKYYTFLKENKNEDSTIS